jgi:pyruvate formate lyase activating enzyme
VAYTYNDPAIFLEYAIDTAIACRGNGIKSVAVTAGYFEAEPRAEFFQYMDAANVDLKGFTEKFYRKLTGSHLESVLETLEYIKHETDVWLELTTLLIPGENDSESEIEEMTQWVMEHLGPDVPLHFSAFHPDWKMRGKQATPKSSLILARQIALKNGIRYAYTGNVHNAEGDTTFCHECGGKLIVRDWYNIREWNMGENGSCASCGTKCSGVFENEPGLWGARRLPISISA